MYLSIIALLVFYIIIYVNIRSLISLVILGKIFGLFEKGEKVGITVRFFFFRLMEGW